jgi:hypothetical protein
MDRGMNEKQSSRPNGKLAAELEHCGDLASRYFSFLSESDPLEDWEDVAPLAEAIAVEKQYPVDRDLVRQLAAVCPSLTRVASAVETHDAIAPLVGLRYAWSRFSLHARLLNAIEVLFPPDGVTPTMVLEPGCFTGGLLHFLANLWQDIPTEGFDLSPVSLDVLKHLSGTLCLQNPPSVIRADFTQIGIGNLPPELREHVKGSLLVLSNMLGTFAQQWDNYPAIDSWHANANLIAYWVRQGAAVLVCERHKDPEVLIETVIREAEWEEGDCMPVLFDVFEALSTHKMSVDNPVGEWFMAHTCVIGFFPPGFEISFDGTVDTPDE